MVTHTRVCSERLMISSQAFESKRASNLRSLDMDRNRSTITAPGLVFLILSFGAVPQLCSAAHESAPTPPPARITQMSLAPGGRRVVHPLSSEGIILIALRDSVIAVKGDWVSLRRGEFKQVQGPNDAKIASASKTPAHLLLVNIRTGDQPLTIEVNKLEGRQSQEDASERNRTLLIALFPLCLLSQRDIAMDENEVSWRPKKPPPVVMRAGQTRWLRAGTYHLENCRDQATEFVTIEW